MGAEQDGALLWGGQPQAVLHQGLGGSCPRHLPGGSPGHGDLAPRPLLPHPLARQHLRRRARAARHHHRWGTCLAHAHAHADAHAGHMWRMRALWRCKWCRASVARAAPHHLLGSKMTGLSTARSCCKFCTGFLSVRSIPELASGAAAEGMHAWLWTSSSFMSWCAQTGWKSLLNQPSQASHQAQLLLSLLI